MRIATLTVLILCLVATPALAFDVTVGTDYDVESDSFIALAEVSQDWQELTFGATISENLSNLSEEEELKLDSAIAWAQIQIDENLSIKAEKDVHQSDLVTMVKVRFNKSY